MIYKIIVLFIPLFFSSCTATTPKNINNICQIFREKGDWYPDVKQASEKWGIPIHVIMAIMHQESHFVADAQPPRTWLLGIIPWFRPSSAYGYSQALDGTWEHYLTNNNYWMGNREDFADSSDFIAWYCATSHHKLGISKQNTQQLYLAYHEGHGGYLRKTYLKKKWLLKTAKKVANKSKQFQSQFSSCKDELESTIWFFW